MRLKDKVAIIVGGGQQPGETIGNGRATALRFAQEGATCLIVDNNEEQAQGTVDAIEAEGGTASVFVADVTDEAQCKAMADACVERYGRIDILHNNVGRSKGDAPATELDADIWDELMTLNTKAMFLTTKHVLPVMRKQKSGSLIYISSTSSVCARPNLAYKVSKGAVNTLTHQIAQENAQYGIRANVIIPGLIDTPMAIVRRAQERGIDPDIIRKERDEQVPMGAMGTAWDVANAALFLASDEARFITSVMLPVDGGMAGRIG